MKDIMEKRDGAFVFKKKDLEIDLDDGTRYVVNPEKEVCLYKMPYRPNGHRTKNHGKQFYRLHFGADWARFEGVDKDYIAAALKDEEIKHNMFCCN